ncbi:MAG: M28 family peptidase [bacterium]
MKCAWIHFGGVYRRAICWLFLFATFLFIPVVFAADPVLARIDIKGPVTAIALPAYAHLRDSAGQEYLLVCADAPQLALSGLHYQVLDTNAVSENYILARQRRAGSPPSGAIGFQVVHDDGVQLIIKASGIDVEALAESGFELARLPKDPIRWTLPATGITGISGPDRLPQEFVCNPMVAEMLSRIETNRLSALMRRISGIEPEVTGGDLYILATRYTYSGAPIQKATQLVYEHLQALGLNAQFHNWSSGMNVVGALPGAALSNEIVLIVAHLDNKPSGPIAPGADDNGSGTVGVLLAAEIFRQYQFERTIRFLLVMNLSKAAGL